jgi:hypothetical protein
MTPTTSTCRLPSTVASPAPDLLDGVVPQDEVDGEEDAGHCAQLPRASGERPEAAVLAAAEQHQERQGEQAPGHRGGGGLDVGEPDQRPGEGDAQGAEERDEHGPAADPLHVPLRCVC